MYMHVHNLYVDGILELIGIFPVLFFIIFIISCSSFLLSKTQNEINVNLDVDFSISTKILFTLFDLKFDLHNIKF